MAKEAGEAENCATSKSPGSSNYRKPNRISSKRCIIELQSSSFSFKEIQAMATTTTPNVETTPKLPVNLTPTAVTKVKEIMAQQNPMPAGLRIGVVGGGCSGFSYSMSFENAPGVMDKVYTFDDLKVYVDATSAMYLNGCVVDFVETLEASGFKFENPNVKSTCGCGSSFNV
jgi:iron-sulfur cluster assembly accessory protein